MTDDYKEWVNRQVKKQWAAIEGTDDRVDQVERILLNAIEDVVKRFDKRIELLDVDEEEKRCIDKEPDGNKEDDKQSTMRIRTDYKKQIPDYGTPLKETDCDIEMIDECGADVSVPLRVEDDCDLGMVAELQKIIRLYDGSWWSDLAERYNTFDDAVNKDGDYVPVRLNVADLLDEILCKYIGEWVRSRCG